MSHPSTPGENAHLPRVASVRFVVEAGFRLANFRLLLIENKEESSLFSKVFSEAIQPALPLKNRTSWETFKKSEKIIDQSSEMHSLTETSADAGRPKYG
jgi:hypothetical protein